VNARNDFGLTPLYAAVMEGHEEIAKLLIAKGANVHAKTLQTNEGRWAGSPGGATALHIAVLSASRDVVEVLLAHGTDARAEDDAGRTPLDLARRDKLSNVVRLLDPNGVGVSVNSTPNR
jgi:ankyrin repeat protein